MCSRFFLLPLLLASVVTAQDIPLPKVSDPALGISLFAAEPLIQTPIGMTFDAAGRLLVIESHTHFRPKDWRGPAHDQVVALLDKDGDGKAETREVFLDQTDMTMDLATHADGSVYVSTREEILRCRDSDGDGRADKIERRLVWLESEGRYPHNGLSGLAFDARGGLYFGMGENLGAAYKLKGSDGTEITDQGEGGNIFSCDKDGKRLRRVATGFWNPFGVCLDSQGHIFATDNDPDSRPPCRLLHVIEGGDYGYQFRYGRSGLHPFVAWNGERIGTLPMLAATGEAPCDVLCYQPRATPTFHGLGSAWQGSLLVASWAEHRIESYALSPVDGTFQTQREMLCEGGQDFRPVAFAVAPDGSLYVSDWVKRDYELHGQGRVWRIAAQQPSSLASDVKTVYPASQEAQLYERILDGPAPLDDELLQWLQNPKPYLFTAAVRRLSHEGLQLRVFANSTWFQPRLTCGLLLASRSAVAYEGLAERRLLPLVADGLISRALATPDEQVMLCALKWVADERLHPYRALIEDRLKDSSLSSKTYYAAMTALARLDDANTSEADLAKRLRADILDPATKPTRTRLALEILPDRDAHLKAADIESLLPRSTSEQRIWLLHYLATLSDPARLPVLHRVALDGNESHPVRIAALCHAQFTEADVASLVEDALDYDNAPALAQAAAQALQGQEINAAQREGLRRLLSGPLSAAIARLRGDPSNSLRPPATEPEAMLKYLDQLKSEPDLDNGKHVFLSARLGNCGLCHRADGIGHSVGPDLTRIGQASDRLGLLTSLLQPSRNIAPQYDCWTVTTSDGQTRQGFLLHEKGSTHHYLDLSSHPFEVKIDHLISRKPLPVSLMPEGLANKLTDSELRDLLAYLQSLGK